MAKARTILAAVNEEGKEWECDIEEVKRVGKYTKGKSRPIKVQFKSKKTVEEIMTVTWRLSKIEEQKHIIIRRDLTQEEREVIKKLQDEAKLKNDGRTEEETQQFFYRIWEMKVRKWYIKKVPEVQNERMGGLLEVRE